jgi:hypothetical protein
MKPFIALACALFMANSLLAEPNYSIAIRQAKNASANETAANQRLLDNPTPVAPPQNNPNTPPDPALQATLQNIESLHTDFAAIGNAQPASISKLADDLTAAIAGKEKLRAPQPKLAQFVHAIFNSSHLTTAQQQMIFNGVQKILTDGGASPDETANVVNDIKTIASETK